MYRRVHFRAYVGAKTSRVQLKVYVDAETSQGGVKSATRSGILLAENNSYSSPALPDLNCYKQRADRRLPGNLLHQTHQGFTHRLIRALKRRCASKISSIASVVKFY